MSRAQTAMSARVRARAALFAAAAFALAFVPGASATEPWTSVGLTKAYTYHADCKTPGLIDPINVVWTGGDPTPWGVEARLHKGSEQGVWTYNDATFFFGNDTFEDKQAVYRIEGGCKTDQAAPATDVPWATERQHARLFHTTKKNANGSYTGYVVADAHEDVENGNCKHHHAAENYPRAKEDLTKEWEFIQLERNEYKEPKPKYWGNYETVRQCNGDFPVSDGWVMYLNGGKATAKATGLNSEEQEAPEITGSPIVGNQLTATPGVWEPRPSAFTYEWAISEPNQNTWTVVQSGENANTWSPPASDVGKLVSVRVRPVGAEPWQAVASNVIRITAGKSFYYRGSNGAIWRATSLGEVRDLGGSAASNARPVSVTLPSGEEDVYFRGSNGEIWLWSLEPFANTWSLRAIGGTAAGDPTVAQANPYNVFFRASEGCIHCIDQLYRTSDGVWHTEAIGGNASGDPTAVASSSGAEEVYWPGSDGAIWELYSSAPSAGGWNVVRVGGTTTSDKPAAVLHTDGTVSVFFRASEGCISCIDQLYWNNSSWRTEWIGGSASGQALAEDEGIGTQNVYWRGTDGAIWVWGGNPITGTWNVNRLGGAPTEDPVEALEPSNPRVPIRLYYFTSSGAIDELYYESTGWGIGQICASGQCGR